MIKDSIPNYVYEKFVNEERDITQAWSNFLQQLITYLQTVISQQGFVVPNLTTNDINEVTANDNTRIDITGAPAPLFHGALYYDTDTNELKFNKDGVITVIA